MSKQNIIEQAYTAFNARDIDGVLKLFRPDVEWPNGWEGGYVYGRAAVRDYWTRQWKEVDPTVTPVNFTELNNGNLEVQVHQIVKNQQEEIIADSLVIHTYIFDEALIKKMIIT